MTKEELAKEAEEYAEKMVNHKMARHDIFVKEEAKKEIMEVFLAGAEPREKRIAELETQIEKMKCCQNCSHLCGLCELGIKGCYVCSKWELRR